MRNDTIPHFLKRTPTIILTAGTLVGLIVLVLMFFVGSHEERLRPVILSDIWHDIYHKSKNNHN